MINSDYIILTPTYPSKLYCFNRFIKNIISFRPKPKEIVFYTEPEMVSHISKWEKELKKQGIELIIFILEPEILNKFPAQDKGKLTYSREYLRHYFINSPYKWALWLDSDIIPEPNVAQVLLKIAQSEKVLVIANQYRARTTDGAIIKGMGCTLTHKAACEFARFQIAPIIWNKKKVGRLADDFWFFAMLSAGEYRIKALTGWNSLKVGRFIPIWHIPRRGRSKFLKKDNGRSKKNN